MPMNDVYVVGTGLHPFGRFPDGLPRSLQIMGPPGSEDAVLYLAERLEAVAPR